jgi:hypothetical protein
MHKGKQVERNELRTADNGKSEFMIKVPVFESATKKIRKKLDLSGGIGSEKKRPAYNSMNLVRQ